MTVKFSLFSSSVSFEIGTVTFAVPALGTVTVPLELV